MKIKTVGKMIIFVEHAIGGGRKLYLQALETKVQNKNFSGNIEAGQPYIGVIWLLIQAYRGDKKDKILKIWITVLSFPAIKEFHLDIQKAMAVRLSRDSCHQISGI